MAAVSAASGSAANASGSAASASGSAASATTAASGASSSQTSASGSAASASGSAASASGSAVSASSSAASMFNFATIAVSGQSSAVADAANDTLTFVAGSGMSLTTDPANDTVTFSSTVAGYIVGSQTSVSIASGDYLGISDVSDSGNNKKALVSDIPAAIVGTGLTASGGTLTITSTDKVLACLTSNQTNVTGDNTAYSVTGAIWTEIFDTANRFSNGTFTAGTTGYYGISLGMIVTGITSSQTEVLVQVITSNRTYRVFDFYDVGGLGSIDQITVAAGIVAADMDAGDTAYLKVTVYGSTKVVDLLGDGTTDLCFFNIVGPIP